MSEQIVLPGFSGDVVLVNGLCYEFAGYTIQPPEDLEVTALFDTCEECGLGVPTVPSSSALSSSGSSIPEPVRCNDCDPQLADTYTIALSGLDSPWGGTPIDWNGSHTAHWNEPHPFTFSGTSECGWQVTAFPAVIATANLVLYWAPLANKWVVLCYAHTAAWLVWDGPTDPCDPRGSYGSHVDCFFNAVSGDPPCDTQGATTCTVS